MGFMAVEAGWAVTEVRPSAMDSLLYSVHTGCRDAHAGIQYSFYLFTVVYFSLLLIVILLLYRQIKMVPKLYGLPV